MEAIVSKISSKYQVVLPRQVREALGLHAGDALLFLVEGNMVLLRARPANFTATLRGLHREVWGGKDPREWLERERSQWD